MEIPKDDIRQPEWRDVVGFEGKYQISESGQVKSLARFDKSGARRKEKFLKQCIGNNGYPKVSLSTEGNIHQVSIHRLVAIAFLVPDPERSQVNHINGNKLNNHYSNLEWCTVGENNRHAFASGLNVAPSGKKGKVFKGTVIATNINTGEEIELNGTIEMLAKGFNDSHVYRCVNGKKSTHKGYTFRRVDHGNNQRGYKAPSK